MADAMIDFIDECAVPVCMVGLLYALPNTQLTRRLASEGRLYQGHDVMSEDRAGDQCSLGINFAPERPLREILTDYKRILESVYSPRAYAGRLDRLATMLDRSGRQRDLHEGDARRRMGSLATVHRIVNAVPEARELFWNTFTRCARANPAALRYIVLMMAIYMYLGPFSQRVIGMIDRRIAALDAAEPASAALAAL